MTDAVITQDVSAISAKVDTATYRKIKAQAALRGTTIAHLLTEALALWLEQNEQAASKDGSQTKA